MMKGIVGKVSHNWIMGWVFDPENIEPIKIDVTYNKGLIARGVANFYREDLLQETKHINGRCGFKIHIPFLNCKLSKLVVMANGEELPFSNHLIKKEERSRQTLLLNDEDVHFFIHIPKTAGTAFKKLLEGQFEQEKIFPNRADVIGNNGLYPHFERIIKHKNPNRDIKLFIGHYPLATKSIFKHDPSLSVLLRDPVERVISNIFHMKNNDPNFKDATPADIYKKGIWHFCNFQIRHLTDAEICTNMRYLDAKTLTKVDLNKAIVKMRSCDFVGISEDLDRSVQLANTIFNWKLEKPKRVNVAKSEKHISKELRARIKKDNHFDILLYKAAQQKFENLCKIHNIEGV